MLLGGNLSQCISSGVQSNFSYQFGFLFKAVSGGGDSYCQVKGFSTSDCSGEDVLNTNGEILISFHSNGTSWDPGSVNFTTPTGTKSISIFCSGANGSGYYDRFYVSPGSDPGYGP